MFRYRTLGALQAPRRERACARKRTIGAVTATAAGFDFMTMVIFNGADWRKFSDTFKFSTMPRNTSTVDS